MKFLFDLFPVILFFIAFKVADIYVATGVAIAATLLQVSWLGLRGRKIDPMLWASLGIILVFGGATLLLHDETFIKWKPTVLYWLFGAVLAGGALAGKNFLRIVFRDQLQLPGEVWTRLTWLWAAFFVFMGAANLFVAYTFSTDIWVNFKVFGGMGLMFLFVLVQGMFILKYVESEK